MAYEPKTWECGETITAEALNHIEQGIANSGGGTEPLIATWMDRDATAEECSNGGTVYECSHSWQDVYDAVMSGRTVLMNIEETAHFDLVTMIDEDEGVFTYKFASRAVSFDTPTAKKSIDCGGAD